jgi:hypothetical protein
MGRPEPVSSRLAVGEALLRYDSLTFLSLDRTSRQLNARHSAKSNACAILIENLRRTSDAEFQAKAQFADGLLGE